jgi:hypothetical protein
MFAVALSAVALAGAAAVPVTGGTRAERAIVRHALAAVDPGVVTSARIDGRRYLVIGPPAPRLPSVRRERALWELQAFVATVAARFAKRHHRLAGYAVSGSFSGPGSPRVGPRGAEALLGGVLARAGAAGIAVRRARILPIGGGLLDVVVRLRDGQLFDEAARTAIGTLFGRRTTRSAALHFLSVEAPDGTALAYGGTFVHGGSWSYGGDMGSAPVPHTVPQRLWRARTNLVVHMTKLTGPVRKRTYHIVCGGSLPAPGSRCRRVLADRWALLVPATGNTCIGSPAGAWNVSVTGVFAGRAIRRAYSGCFGATVKRWTRFLGA